MPPKREKHVTPEEGETQAAAVYVQQAKLRAPAQRNASFDMNGGLMETILGLPAVLPR